MTPSTLLGHTVSAIIIESAAEIPATQQTSADSVTLCRRSYETAKEGAVVECLLAAGLLGANDPYGENINMLWYASMTAIACLVAYVAYRMVELIPFSSMDLLVMTKMRADPLNRQLQTKFRSVFLSKRRIAKHTGEIYNAVLGALAENPDSSDLRILAVDTGRWHYASGRPGNAPTIYDEQAIQNDITARTGGVSPKA